MRFRLGVCDAGSRQPSTPWYNPGLVSSRSDFGPDSWVLVFQVDLIAETAAVTARLLQLIKEYPTGGKQIHDANIVATMLVNGIDTLLTQNIDDMKRFENEITLIPLKADG